MCAAIAVAVKPFGDLITALPPNFPNLSAFEIGRISACPGPGSIYLAMAEEHPTRDRRKRPRKSICLQCGGTGYAPGRPVTEPVVACSVCKGSGGIAEEGPPLTGQARDAG